MPNKLLRRMLDRMMYPQRWVVSPPPPFQLNQRLRQDGLINPSWFGPGVQTLSRRPEPEDEHRWEENPSTGLCFWCGQGRH